MRTAVGRCLSASLGRRCAAWIRDPEQDPVRLDVLGRNAGEVSMRVFHNDLQYYLYLDLTGNGLHHCTCGDFSLRGRLSRRVRTADLFCRHIVAAALKEGRLELLLSLLTRAH